MAYSLNNVACAGFALSPYHGSALVDPAESLAQVLCAAYEGNVKGGLVDVVLVIGGGENFALVDVVYFNGLEYLSLSKMTDTALCHYGDRNSFLNALYHLGVAHSGNAACCTDIGRYSFQRHNCAGTCCLGDLCLLGSGNVHYNSALEHLGKVLIKLVSFVFHIISSLERICCGETIITPVGKIIKHDEKNTYLLSFVNMCQIALL